MDLSDFIDLKELVIREQGITNLDITENSLLQKVDLRDNLLETIKFSKYSPNLRILNLTNNNLVRQNLECLSRFTALEYIEIGTHDRERINGEIYNR
jgi:hypothetical protein